MNSQPRGVFETTRWSTIARVWSGDRAPGDALVELGQRFRYPVYAYLRAQGHPPSEALVRTESFLATLDTAARCAEAAPREAQFRRFLVEQLDAWTAGRPASVSRS